MTTIPIERLRELFIYDPATGLLTNRVDRGSRAREGREAGNKDSQGYRIVRVDKKMLKVHRIIWALQFDEWPEGPLDHIDGVVDNNRIANLRVASYADNNRNRRITDANSSGHKGVNWCKRSQKWRVGIKVNRRPLHIGMFSDFETAAKAYREAAVKYFGAFARFR